MHGGTVDAASAGEGKGATFTVRLPVSIVHPKVRHESAEHPRSERIRPLEGLQGLEGVRVVAVDDEPDALSLLRTVLESAGAQVTTFGSASAALAALPTVAPQVLVVDIGMPSIDGYEFIRRVRDDKDERVKDVPAAALTAFARTEDRTKALHAGFEIHLAKPVDPSELVASVVTLVRRSRVR
jgi:CheY-like chemotaxis protein